MGERIYHITTIEEWEKAKSAGEYRPKRFAKDGFIHSSYRDQLVRVANSLFTSRKGLVILAISRSNTGCKVIDENLEGGAELFPHIYGALPVSAVRNVIPFPCNEDGSFSLPEELAEQRKEQQTEDGQE